MFSRAWDYIVPTAYDRVRVNTTKSVVCQIHIYKLNKGADATLSIFDKYKIKSRFDHYYNEGVAPQSKSIKEEKEIEKTNQNSNLFDTKYLTFIINYPER